MNPKNLRLASKLWLSAVFIVLGISLVVGYTAVRSNSDRVESTAVLDRFNARVKMTIRWAGLTQANAARSQAVLLSNDPAVELGLKDEIAATSAEIGQMQKAIEAEDLTAADRSQLATIASNRVRVLETRALAMKQRAAGQSAEVSSIVSSQYQPAMEAYQKSQRDFVAMQEQNYESTRVHYVQLDKSVALIAGGLILLLLLCVVLGAAWLIGSIRQPLMQANALAARIAKGDLSARIDTKRTDEFGDLMRSLGSMSESLGQMVNQVRYSTDSIATASSEIACGNNDLAQRTEQTSSNLQSTASSMGSLTQTVQISAENARQASSLAATASSVAQRGGEVVRQVVRTMEDINESSRKIADIIGVIDGIAFQTNILALNAAVEAARAGEQGRGFAVVASEVRSLAGRSAEAAKEIKQLISSSVDKVASGTQLVSDAGATMNDIVQSVQKVADVIGEITATSGEQSSGISEINGAIGQLDQMTQQNAALVEQSAAAAESLRDQAAQLARAVAVFKTSNVATSMAQRPPRAIPTPRMPQVAYRAPARLPKAPAKPALANRPVLKQLGSSVKATTPKTALSRPALPRPNVLKPAPARQTAAPAGDSDWETF
jgi:methyl-accepting chemotaxis protein